MTLIHVPKPPKTAMDPNRPVSSLLKTQIEHLHDAERRLPLRYRSEIYVNTIRTERDAANYISTVTEAIRTAHTDAKPERRARRTRRVVEIAAKAEKPVPKRTRKAKSKKKRTRKATRKGKK
jgi:hypothetical protein